MSILRKELEELLCLMEATAYDPEEAEMAFGWILYSARSHNFKLKKKGVKNEEEETDEAAAEIQSMEEGIKGKDTSGDGE